MQKGVLDLEKLTRLSQFPVLLVCTGNSCRSPMAEVLLRQIIATQFPEVAAREPLPFVIGSAGLSAFPGGPASVEAIAVMRKRGLNLTEHQSRSVTEHSLRHADVVLTMTHSHRSAIVDRLPEFDAKVDLLSGSNADVSDPFGGSESVYAACAEQIEHFLQARVATLDETYFPQWSME